MMTAEEVTAAAAEAESQQKATTSKKKPQAKKMKAIEATNKNKVCRANQVTKIKQRTPNFLVSEDVALCEAYVNCTLNPLVDSDQKAEVFWNAVLDAYTTLNGKGAKDNGKGAKGDNVFLVQRESATIRSRFQRTIARQMKEWNPIYKRIAMKEA
jgi:hypothetical protein